MINKPFNGNGIPSDLNESSSALYNDEYFQLLKKTLTSKNIVNSSKEETKNLQKSLLYPYLQFFIRNDKDDFYKIISIFLKKTPHLWGFFVSFITDIFNNEFGTILLVVF